MPTTISRRDCRCAERKSSYTISRSTQYFPSIYPQQPTNSISPYKNQIETKHRISCGALTVNFPIIPHTTEYETEPSYCAVTRRKCGFTCEKHWYSNGLCHFGWVVQKFHHCKYIGRIIESRIDECFMPWNKLPWGLKDWIGTCRVILYLHSSE